MPSVLKRQSHGLVGPASHVTAEAAPTDPEIYRGLSYTVETTEANIPEDELWAAPIMIPGGTEFDRVGIRTGGGGTTIEVARFGLYHSDPIHGGPGKLLKELGQVGTPAGGALAANSNHNATATCRVDETAIYWLVVQAESDTAAAGLFSEPQRGGGLMKTSILSVAANPAGPAWGYRVAGQAPGSLADPFPTPVSGRVDIGPLIYLRVLKSPPPRRASKRDRRPRSFWGLPGEDTIHSVQFDDTDAGYSSVANTFYAWPIVLQVPKEINWCGNIGADAIYDSDATGYPNRRLWAGAAGAMGPLFLAPGVYWLVHHYAGAAGLDAAADGHVQFCIDNPTVGPDAGFSIADGGAATPPDPFPKTAPTGRLGASLNRFVRYEPKGINLHHRALVDRGAQAPYTIFHPGWWVTPVAYPWLHQSTKLDTASNGFLFCIPVWMDRKITFDQFWLYINTFGSAHTCAMGIYYDDGCHRPRDLMLESATQVINANGWWRWNRTFTLAEGAYWLAVHIGTPAPPGFETLSVEESYAWAYERGWRLLGRPNFAWSNPAAGNPPLPNPFNGTGHVTVVPLCGMRILEYA